jgi:hypothetical protein
MVKKYEISISIVEGIENNNEALQSLEELRDQMDEHFPNKSIELKLIVNYLDNVVKVLK